MSGDRTTILALRAVAALAEKLADDLEKNRLWEGEFGAALAEISRNLQSVRRSTP